MTWLLWRQHRVQIGIAAAVVVLLAVPVWITGNHLAAALTACRAGASCGGLFQGYKAMDTIVNITVIVPLVIGVFLGATIVARELEAGTATLAWTQSVTRRRWLTTKLLTLFALTAACSGAVAGLVTWWSRTRNVLLDSRFNGLQFDIQGIAPVAYALFASALGLAAGVLWRRALPAMATTVGGFVGLRLAVELAWRPHYAAPVTKLTALGPTAIPAGTWVESTDLMLHGHVVSGAVAPPAACTAAETRAEMSACMARVGYRMRTVYQPAGRYWTFQWIEFGIFASLAVLLVAIAVVTMHRRDA